MTVWWIIFGVGFTVLLFLDLFLHRKDRLIQIKDAMIWITVFILVALIFNIFVYIAYNNEKTFHISNGVYRGKIAQRG